MCFSVFFLFIRIGRISAHDHDHDKKLAIDLNAISIKLPAISVIALHSNRFLPLSNEAEFTGMGALVRRKYGILSIQSDIRMKLL